jgi:transcriptional regulator with XRE-family HTH domain
MIDEDAILLTVAGNCGRLRKTRQFTFDEFSKRSGVSKGMLVEIEQGRRNPSIATMCRMANALGVSVAELLEQESTQSRLVVRKPADGRVLWETKAGGRATLIDTVRIDEIAAEIWRWRFAAGEFFDGIAHPTGTTEFLSILRGTLTVTAGADPIHVRAGSTARLLADIPHRYANSSNATCEFQMLVLEPVG